MLPDAFQNAVFWLPKHGISDAKRWRFRLRNAVFCNNPARIAHHRTSVGHVAEHHCSGTDGSVVAYLHAAEDGGTCINLHVVANGWASALAVA